MENTREEHVKNGFPSHPWRLSYKTSSLIDGRPVNILHDFYIPALKLAVRYDRVAGYFRSSSLAAASQGFSSFVRRDGKMRLIVGADLDPEDVKAILAGDAQRLEARLNHELEHFESWPEDVQNGVSLLSWMVAHGVLEVRVAFRLHIQTGEPIPFDSVEDGYVHEKWFVMYDEYGNRLYGSGSLNESKNAFVFNAENIDIHCDWKSETDKERVEQAVAEFEMLWNGKLPHLPVMTLPEAVRRRMLTIAENVSIPKEVDGTAAPHTITEPSVMERLQFAILSDGPKLPYGRLVGVETAPVAPWPHQHIVVRRLIETWPYSYLLCDEVGLGKTIEAGLAFRALYLSGLVKRILIAAPASLTKQWQRQMASKMLLSFGRVITTPGLAHEYEWPQQEVRPAQSMYEPGLVIVSTGLIHRKERENDLKIAPPFDIVLVDEAHAARRQNPTAGVSAYPEFGQLYKVLKDIIRDKTRSLWLATATPMQLDPVEVCDLLALTNRVGVFQFDPTLTLEYYHVLEKLLRSEPLEPSEWTFLQRTIHNIQDHDRWLWQYLERYVIDQRSKYDVERWLKYGTVPRGPAQQFLVRLLFSGAPLSRVMMRHTRSLLEVYREKGQLKQNLAKRQILPLQAISFSEFEERISEQLEAYCHGLKEQMQHLENNQERMLNFYISFLRLRFASSMYAFRETLKRRLKKVEAALNPFQRNDTNTETNELDLEDIVYEGEDDDDVEVSDVMPQGWNQQILEWEKRHIEKMLQQMTHLPHSSKMQVVLKTLYGRKDRSSGRIQQTVIFTRFYDTLFDIVSRLRQVDPKMRIGTYSGKGAEYYDPILQQMTACDRETVKERFLKGDIDVLVCTDAAAEGLNLQTADLLINFDLGWNPMKIEQRIGRIDRIGQKHQRVFVLNLCYAKSAEAIVYGRLLERLQKAQLLVGPQQISLLPVRPEEFQFLEEGTLSEEELFTLAMDRLQEQRRHQTRTEIPADDLYEIYQRYTKQSEQASSPVTLEAIWETLATSRYLQSCGCLIKTKDGEEYLEIHGIAGIPDGTVLTASRKLYEEGLDGNVRVHFASYGDPYFERILEHMQQYELPSCVQRIHTVFEEMNHVERVGYAVVSRGNNGLRHVRLILSWNDLKDISLKEDDEITEPEVEQLVKSLRVIALNELGSNMSVERTERKNLRAANGQVLFNLLIIRDLLQVKAGNEGGQAIFGSVMRDVETLAQRERILISNIPRSILESFQDQLPYEVRVPSVGDNCSVRVPRFAIKSAVDAGKRLAESLKTKKSELTVQRVIQNIETQIQKMISRL